MVDYFAADHSYGTLSRDRRVRCLGLLQEAYALLKSGQLNRFDQLVNYPPVLFDFNDPLNYKTLLCYKHVCDALKVSISLFAGNSSFLLFLPY